MLSDKRNKRVINYIKRSIHRISYKLLWILLLFISTNAFSQEDNTDSHTGSTVTGMDLDSTKELIVKGIGKMKNGEYNAARTYYQEARIRSEKQDSTRLNILAILNMGSLFYYLNEPDSALSYYYLALDIAEKSESLNFQNTINNNIGIIYATTGHHEDARKVIEKALAISVLLNDTFKIALNLSNLGAENISLNNLAAAEGNLLRAQSYLEQIGDSSSLVSVYSNLGKLHYIDSNFVKALESYQMALDFAHTNLHAIDESAILNNIGQTQLALKNYDLAVSYLDSAYKLALAVNQLDEASVSLYWLTTAFFEQSDLEKALVYAKKSLEIKDSIIQISKADWIKESKVKYQFELKEREYALLKVNSEKRTFFVRVILGALLVIIALLVVILRMRMKTSKLKEAKHNAENIISTQKLQEVKTRNIELQETIETINYELVSKTLLIENKNQILDSIGSVLNEAEMSEDPSNNQHVRQLKQHLLRDSNLEQNWEDFKLYFERVHTDFFQKIHRAYPNLTSNDLRLMAFVLLQFNAKEIAQILNISPDSVRKRKQRLREKLNLKKGDDLLNYLYSYTS